jgi:hypothetical protein
VKDEQVVGADYGEAVQSGVGALRPDGRGEGVGFRYGGAGGAPAVSERVGRGDVFAGLLVYVFGGQLGLSVDFEAVGGGQSYCGGDNFPDGFDDGGGWDAGDGERFSGVGYAGGGGGGMAVGGRGGVGGEVFIWEGGGGGVDGLCGGGGGEGVRRMGDLLCLKRSDQRPRSSRAFSSAGVITLSSRETNKSSKSS